jgi:hypothetical protein
MKYEHLSIERRRFARASARGAAILRGVGIDIYGRAIAVNTTDLEVRCELGALSTTLIGAPVEVEMRLDGRHGTWFLLQGHVTQIRPATQTVIVSIEELPPTLLALVAARTIDLAMTAPVIVMVVDRDLARRQTIAEAFRGEGCHVREAGTPLEALDALDNGGAATDIFAVIDTAPDHIGIDLRAFFDATYPDAMVLDAGWVTSLGANDELRSRVHALVLARGGQAGQARSS